MINGEYQIEQPKKSLVKLVSLLVLLLLVVAVVFVVYFFTKINRGASDQSFPVAVTISKGLSTKQIASQLSESNVIRNPNIFLIYSIFTDASDKIQAGDYVLDRKMSIVEIVDVLTAGKVTRQVKKLTLIEGWTNKQFAESMEKRGIDTQSNFDLASKNDYSFKFLDIAKPFGYEGFLFPDTYEIPKDGGANELIAHALENFESKIKDKMLQDIQARNLSLKDVIILASIIEREVGRSSSVELTEEVLATMQRERELVASVFYNRLKLGMMLQSDATVNYVTGKSDRQATFEDLEIDSNYNTYKYAGLPPGPIGNPGLDSIMAAIYPAQSDYLYFLSKPSGEAVFGKTIEEHNLNRAKYLD